MVHITFLTGAVPREIKYSCNESRPVAKPEGFVVLGYKTTLLLRESKSLKQTKLRSKCTGTVHSLDVPASSASII